MNILATLNSTVRQLCAMPILRAGAVVVMASGVGLFGSMQKANAAEKIVLTYGYFGRSITVEELEEFAQTGRQTPTLKFLLNATKQEPDDVRQF